MVCIDAFATPRFLRMHTSAQTRRCAGAHMCRRGGAQDSHVQGCKHLRPGRFRTQVPTPCLCGRSSSGWIICSVASLQTCSDCKSTPAAPLQVVSSTRNACNASVSKSLNPWGACSASPSERQKTQNDVPQVPMAQSELRPISKATFSPAMWPRHATLETTSVIGHMLIKAK